MRNVRGAYTGSQDITIEEIKACPEFRNIPDDKAKIILETIKKFTLIVYDFYQRKKSESRLESRF